MLRSPKWLLILYTVVPLIGTFQISRTGKNFGTLFFSFPFYTWVDVFLTRDCGSLTLWGILNAKPSLLDDWLVLLFLPLFIWKAQNPKKVTVSVGLLLRENLNRCNMLQQRKLYSLLSPSWWVLCQRSECLITLFLHYNVAPPQEQNLSWVVNRSRFDLYVLSDLMGAYIKKFILLWD